MKRKIIGSVIGLIPMLMLAGCGHKATISLTTVYDGAVIDLCSEGIRKYLEADTEAEQIEALTQFWQTTDDQTTYFEWESDGSTSYTVLFADNKKFDNAISYETTETCLENQGTFVPGQTYYWKVEGNVEGSTSKIDTFTTKDVPVRYITTTGIINVRDIGGWKTEEGRTVKYGLIYRGARTNTVDDNNCDEKDKILFTETLGIRTEIDLRGEDNYGQTRSVFGDDIFYLKARIGGYASILPEFSWNGYKERAHEEYSVESIQKIFTMLADEDNYPIFFHCNQGADRTGTLAFLINGLLGVSYEDLTRDFELTSFSDSGKRYRSNITDDEKFDESGVMRDDNKNFVGWGHMYQMIMEHYATEDGTLQSAIENYLLNVCGVEQAEIDSLKNIMLQ